MYNWNNLICNPEDERIQGLIGEEVFASISPMYTMLVAERGEYVQKLIGVDLNFTKAPFICENSYKGIKELNKCSCIIPKNLTTSNLSQHVLKTKACCFCLESGRSAREFQDAISDWCHRKERSAVF